MEMNDQIDSLNQFLRKQLYLIRIFEYINLLLTVGNFVLGNIAIQNNTPENTPFSYYIAFYNLLIYYILLIIPILIAILMIITLFLMCISNMVVCLLKFMEKEKTKVFL
jgi:hypothetical protein